MRLASTLCLPLVVASALACELKVVPGDSDSESDTGSTSATASSSTTAGTTVGTSESSSSSTSNTTNTSNTTSEPVDPVPCEGASIPIVAETSAYKFSQIPPDPNPTTTGSSTAGGDPLHPDTLFVRLSSQANTCEDPNKNLACGQQWEVTIAIPPEFQKPGLYHLLGTDVLGLAFETGVPNDIECSLGGGSFSATFELISIDDKQVEGRLCHVEHFFFFLDSDPDLEGSFTAPRCPG